MKKIIRRLIYMLPPVKNLEKELAKYKTYHAPGHYYSPVPDKEYVRANAARIFDRSKRELHGIDIRDAEQRNLLESFATYYRDQPFTVRQTPANRYFLENGLFSYCDGLFLQSMIRHFKPKRIIEAGSGFSSAVMLDVNERFFDNKIDIVLIEPYPVSLEKLTAGHAKHFRFEKKFIQDVELDLFGALQKDDILFIDSTHVSKAGSDVNHILFEVLPVLNEGVIVHFHDVFWPFEYPEGWVEKGFAWNEDYMLRAFLMYNARYEIMFFNSYVERFHKEWITVNMPDILKNPGGSLYLRKVKAG